MKEESSEMQKLEDGQLELQLPYPLLTFAVGAPVFVQKYRMSVFCFISNAPIGMERKQYYSIRLMLVQDLNLRVKHTGDALVINSATLLIKNIQ